MYTLLPFVLSEIDYTTGYNIAVEYINQNI